ncbi:hypothetical protein B0H15DRAFT_799479 [Mycena belliarum]|uniref:Uncharacterized protein n=1 Tax=Mycena belliarum TaxID=1033014 RepID=A0AAD6U627_9AGAR|nr:hypothetical protein B0H15DRAFT_799479 [Mycena belliae]
MRASTAAALLVGLLSSLVFAVTTAETVLTPGGYRSKANVHEIPVGGSLAHVGDMIHVLAANGTVLKVVHRRNTAKREPAVLPLKTGWIAYASWLNYDSSPIASFTTTWEVPAVPTENHGQTVFLFNSIEPTSGPVAILQPVLQYGPSAAGGGSFWAVASWYISSSDQFHTTPVRTSAGTTLNGVITLTGTSSDSSLCNYTTQFIGISETFLYISGVSQLRWATETLEAYGVTSINDYPASSTVFSGINLKLADGATPIVSWSTQSDATDGLITTVNTDGATDAEITIEY